MLVRSEIVSGESSGGANTSHTILLESLRRLLNAVPESSHVEQYKQAVISGNVLGKATESSRRRTFRYLRELYLLDPNSVLFRALRDLWADDQEAQPLLALLCAVARDPVLRASADAVMAAQQGASIQPKELADDVQAHFPDSYGDATLAKIGRNTASSWTQSGHLQGTRSKVRSRAQSGPSTVAFALLLGHLEGARGEALLSSLWTHLLDAPTSEVLEHASAAGARGLIEFRSAGGVIDIGFRHLLRPFGPDTG
jgi:hypothetical protein